MAEVGIGTAVLAYIEPHAGQALAFNRWYERDHMYAAATAGPGCFAGARWVATRACKALRPAGATWFGDPARGSYLTTLWLLPETQAEWDAWIAAQMGKLAAEGDRMFAGRDHLHTAAYRFVSEARSDDGDAAAAATALDRPFDGLLAIAVEPGRGADWAAAVVGGDVRVAAVFARDRVIMADAEAPDHDLVLAFTVGDPLAAWDARVVSLARDASRGRLREPVPPYYPGNGRLRRGSMNRKLYIHEFIDIIGHNRARYMHHMTANWCPIGKRERNMNCFGVWATVGSTGAWPQVVNMWELNGWKGMAANFEHELVGTGAQDPSLAEWWAAAAELRRGGFDRIVAPERWSPTIDELTKAGVKGAVYAHELVKCPAGGARAFLEALAETGRSAVEEHGLQCVGAFRVVMGTDTEAIVIWALPDLATWAAFERAWERGALASWRHRLGALGTDMQRTLLVDAPLSPMRIGRQPLVSDRRPLTEI